MRYGEIATSASAARHPNLWDGLAGAWVPALGATGYRMPDVSGNRRNGNLEWYSVSDCYGVFSGKKGIRSTTTQSKINVGDIHCYNGISVVGVCRLDQLVASHHHVIAKRVSGQSVAEFGLRLKNSSSNKKLEYYHSAGNEWQIWEQNEGDTVSDTKWHTLAVTFDYRSDPKFFVDGKGPYDSTLWFGSWAYVPQQTSVAAKIGGWADDAAETWQGGFSSVYLYDRVLQPSEVRQIHFDDLAPLRVKRSSSFLVPTAAAQEDYSEFSLSATSGMIHDIQAKAAGAAFSPSWAAAARRSRFIGSGIH